MQLEDAEYWSMTHNPDTRSIELDWKDTTSAMTDEDFKQALEHLAAHIRDRSATGTMIDVRTFAFRMTPELDRWRLENIIPAYNAGGLERFAYVLPPGMPYRPGDGGDAAEFTTDYFDDPEQARSWLKGA
jgi:glucan phosphorylase